MATITIRNLDDAVKKQLRIRAAMNGCSMEEEARRILRRGLTSDGEAGGGVGSRIHRRFSKVGGVELEIAPRSKPRSAPDFSGKKE